MNFEINSFSVVFIVLILYLLVIVPVSGYIEYKKLNQNKSDEPDRKLREYRHTIIWSWIPVVLIVILLPSTNETLSNIGFRWININASGFSKWVVIPFLVLCLVYLLYNIYSIIVLNISKEARAQASKNIPEQIKTFLPKTKEEKKAWVFVALSAGFTEEIVYRGYFFFAFGLLFPTLSIFYILLISTVLFGIGHIYQGKEVIKPTILGLIFGFSFIIFDSIIPVIVMHIVQDLVITNLVDEV